MVWLLLTLMFACACGQVAVYAWMIHDIERNRVEWKKYHAELDARIEALRRS